MTIPLLIGLAGPAGCGKTTAQRIIADSFGLARLNFADPIKDALQVMLDLTDKQLHGDQKERVIAHIGKSPRELMQTLGTEWAHRYVRRDLWVAVAEQRLAMLENLEDGMYQGCVISDVRYDLEAEWLRRHGGLLIHIERHDVEDIAAHCSEFGVTPAIGDALVFNDSDELGLEEELTRVIEAEIDRRAAA